MIQKLKINRFDEASFGTAQISVDFVSVGVVRCLIHWTK